MALVDPAAYIQRRYDLSRWERRTVDPDQDGRRLEHARAEDARLGLELRAVPPPSALVWPLPEAPPQSPAPSSAVARTWKSLRRSSMLDVQTWLWLALDLLLHGQRVLLPERRGRPTLRPWLLVRRTESYYKRGAGGVDLDRREMFHVLNTHLRLKPIRARDLCAAGVSVPPGATTGWYRFDDDQRADLLIVVRALYACGIRLPSDVTPPRLTRSPSRLLDPGPPIRIEYRGGKIPCPHPDHDDQHPSAVPYPCGGVYCFGCGAFVGEWRDAEIQDWNRRVVYDKSLRAQEVEAQGGCWPTEMAIRLYRSPTRVVAGSDVQEEDEPDLTRQLRPTLQVLEGGKGRGGRRAGAGRPVRTDATRGAKNHSSCNSYDPPPKHTSASDLGGAGSEAATSGDPGLHPMEKLIGKPGIDSDPTRWRMLRRTLPISQPSDDMDASTRIRPFGYIRAQEFANPKSGKAGMGREFDAQLDLIDVQRQADSRSLVASVVADAQKAYDLLRAGLGGRIPRASILTDEKTIRSFPDKHVKTWKHLQQRYVSVGLWRRSNLRVMRAGRQDLVVASTFDHEVCTRYVLIDIDGLTIPRVPADPEQAAVYAEVSDGYLARGPRKLRARRYYAHLEVGDQAIARAAQQVQDLVSRHPDYTGRIYVLRTGPSGVQVAAELRQTRWDTRALWACQDFRAQVQRLADLALAALHAEGCQDGRIDPSSFARGRLGRRAGWRLAKDGTLFRSRLIYASSRRPWEV